MHFDELASDTAIEKVLASFPARNFTGSVVANSAEALEKIKTMIPAGKSVMTGSSVTLEQIGFIDLLKSGNHPWHNLKDAIVAEKDPAKQSRLRKEATIADYFLGSVHALTEEGEALIASNTGSQLPGYTFNGGHVVWIVSTQKIVPNLTDAWRRLEEHVLPLENKHLMDLYGRPSNISKVLLFKKEVVPERVHIVLVKEKLGF